MTKATPKHAQPPEGAAVSAWRGYQRYACTKCEYDTLDRTKFVDHWAAAHPEPLDDFAEAAAPVAETLAED